MANSKKSTRRVAMVFETAVSPRRRALAGIGRYMREHEAWNIYLRPAFVEASVVDWIKQWRGDGVIAALTNSDRTVLDECRIPVVDMNGAFRDDRIPLVHADDEAIGRLGAEHLIERGFRNFGFCEYSGVVFSQSRRIGFEKALQAHEHTYKVISLASPARGQGGPNLWETQQQALMKWVHSAPKPFGIMTSSDQMGQYVLEACQRAGALIPEEVAVVGADNDELMCNVCFPPLSSVVIDDEARGYRAAAVLDDMMAGRPVEKTYFIAPPGVARRASTDVLATNDPVIAQVLRYLRDHACDHIGVNDIVAITSLSRTLVERRFKRQLGRTINEEIVRLRVDKAIELLSSTRLTPKAVAIKAGFRTTSYMGTIFRKRLGRTPGSYRVGRRRSWTDIDEK